MCSPVFTEALEIAIVVRDLDTPMRHYRDDYGIGLREVQEFNSREVDNQLSGVCIAYLPTKEPLGVLTEIQLSRPDRSLPEAV